MYALLWESAYKDVRIDRESRRKKLPVSEYRDCGGTSEWSIKGIADFLCLGKATVLKAMTALLENGFISIDGRMSTGQGSQKRVFRVTAPSELEARRYAVSIMGTDRLDTQSSGIKTEWEDDDCMSTDDCTSFLEEEYDPGFGGLWEGDFSQNVRDRLDSFSSNKQQHTERRAGVSQRS